MPNALTIGVPYDLFWNLNPTKLKPFQTAFENQRKMRDEENWLIWGTYAMSMFSTVLASVFSKNSQAKYIENPVYQSAKENSVQMTQEEKQQKIENLFMQLQIMETNYNLSHKDGSE